MMCNKCNVEMVVGIALKHQYDVGARYIAPRLYEYMKTPEIIKCLKCPKCGHSDDDLSK